MVRYGLNPGACGWLDRLPLFADPIRRGRVFEVFKEDGTPLGEESELWPDGWPKTDGRWHGVRLFGSMEGFMPHIAETSDQYGFTKVKPGHAAYMARRIWFSDFQGPILKPAFGTWHIPSLEALAYFKPKVLRTLDWGWQRPPAKRPDWTKPRVLPTDPLQGTPAGMALELQCDAANKPNCHLWWNAPPRFELSTAEYEDRLEGMLTVIREITNKPPILEYGNELWNDGFPVKRWLDGDFVGGTDQYADHVPWHERAAVEIGHLKRVAERVFGESGILGQKPYWIFVGGHIGTPDTLNKILGALEFTPDIAGPAFYVVPLKADRDRWMQTGEIPTQEELAASMKANLPALRVKLDAHRSVLSAHDVPYLGVYEAGQSLISNGRPWKKAAIEAQRTEWMGGIYSEIRKHMKEAGVELCNWYCASGDQSPADSRTDPFGLLEATLDKAEPLPKARAARGDA